MFINSELEKMEVTKHNFEDEFPLLVQRIKNAAFVAIDTEFTALTIDEKTEKSRYIYSYRY